MDGWESLKNINFMFFSFTFLSEKEKQVDILKLNI